MDKHRHKIDRSSTDQESPSHGHETVADPLDVNTHSADVEPRADGKARSREDKLAAALRDNLRRRKAAERRHKSDM